MLNTENRMRLVEAERLATLLDDYIFHIHESDCPVEDDQAMNIATCCRIIARNVGEVFTSINKEEDAE